MLTLEPLTLLEGGCHVDYVKSGQHTTPNKFQGSEEAISEVPKDTPWQLTLATLLETFHLKEKEEGVLFELASCQAGL